MTNTKPIIKIKIGIAIFSLFASLVSASLRALDNPYYRFVFLILTILSFYFIKKDKYYIYLSTSFFSVGISYFFELASILLVGSLFYIIGYHVIDFYSELICSFLQIILVYIFLKTKRFNKGFTFVKDKNNFGKSIVAAGPIVLLTSIQRNTINNAFLSFILIGIFISSIGLFLWLRSAITRHYRKKLEIRAEEFSKHELDKKDKEIKRLLDENTSLSSIIHLDNYLINKMETTLRNKNDEAINNLLELSKQRNDFVNNKLINDKILPSTGNVEIDAVITDMYIKTAARGIDFDLNVDCDINYLIHNIIDQTDFEELISSCITNSIVDIENNPDTNGKILITISKPNDIYKFAIMDNGVSKEDNNSISKIIENSKASIKSNTFDSNDSFTKSLTIRFDGLSVHKNVSVEKENYY